MPIGRTIVFKLQRAFWDGGTLPVCQDLICYVPRSGENVGKGGREFGWSSLTGWYAHRLS